MKGQTKLLIVVIAFLFIMVGCGVAEEQLLSTDGPAVATAAPTRGPAGQPGALFPATMLP